MRAGAVLLAAGRGERLGTDVPKGFVELDGRSLLARSLDAVRSCKAIDVVAVVVPEGWEDRAVEVAGGAAVVKGGETRQRSVASGLEVLERDGRPQAVICHDVARPLAPASLFEAVLAALDGADGAIPALPMVDTVKRVDDGFVAETLARDDLVAVQTPQAFRWDALKRAHQLAEEDGFQGTDDAALLEHAGFRVAVVPGDPVNIKVTGPQDLHVASLLGRARA